MPFGQIDHTIFDVIEENQTNNQHFAGIILLSVLEQQSAVNLVPLRSQKTKLLTTSNGRGW